MAIPTLTSWQDHGEEWLVRSVVRPRRYLLALGANCRQTAAMDRPPPMTVVELPTYLSQAAAFLSEEERQEIAAFLAFNPTAGVLMRATGGVRKLRVGAKGKGKRGGGRVIYYYHDGTMPIFLLAAYEKSRSDNLTQAERNALAKLVPVLVAHYRGHDHGA